MKNIFFFFLSIFAILPNYQAQTTSSFYKIGNPVFLEGNEKWDLITSDEENDRLFVSRSNMVQVVDLKAGKQVGTIPETKGIHGIAIAYDFNKGFTSNGKDSTVTVFDLKTLSLLKKVKVTGAKPDAIIYDKFSKKVFVFNNKSSNATVIDAKSDNILETISLPGKPELSVSNENGKVYVNIEDKNIITVINTLTLKIEQNWLLGKGEEPTGLAIDITTHRLFSVCSNKLIVILNAENGKIIATLPIGEHCDGVVFDPVKKRAYTSNGEGTVTVVQEENENEFRVMETIKTQKGAKTLALNSKTHQIFLPVADLGEAPEPTKEEPKPKPIVKPGTFRILQIETLK